MPRQPRDFDSDVPYHAWSKGSFGQPIYVDDFERTIWLLMLSGIAITHGWKCLAWCQMTNHFHLFVRAPRGNLSDGMQLLNGGFSRWANWRHHRRGHLFENRFGARGAESESHLLEIARYVVLNPVYAGICRHPSDWPWSSFRATAGSEFAPDFLAVDELLRVFGSTPEVARVAYRRFVDDGVDAVKFP